MGPVNIPLDPHTFAIIRERARDYLNTRDRLYCFDGFAGWDPKYRIKVRVILFAAISRALHGIPCSSGQRSMSWKTSAIPT
ncbi:MAG TPA: phosphoenolpyruvate carboxykinase (ATP) [Chthoniobacterales bacterium]|nr:phosphoenolpyruvate carboxykinase (ATP) [Chthoniobacterales bacterium]